MKISTICGDHGNITRQKKEISDYCNENGLVLKKAFEDNGGAGNSADRGGLYQMFEYLASSKGHDNILVLTNFDRLSRDYFLFLKIRKKINGYGFRVISLNKGNELTVVFRKTNGPKKSKKRLI